MITGHIFMFIVFVVLLIPLKNQAVYYESKLVNKIMYETPILSNSTSKITSAISEIDELGVAVADKTISKNDANLRGLDIILKYNYRRFFKICQIAANRGGMEFLYEGSRC